MTFKLPPVSPVPPARTGPSTEFIKAILLGEYSMHPSWQYMKDEYDRLEVEHDTIKSFNVEMAETLRGLLDRYLELKRLSLVCARSDAPNWMPGLTEEGDVHVIAARAMLAKVSAKQ